MYIHALNQSIKGVESKGWATLSYLWTPLSLAGKCSSTAAIADGTKMSTVSLTSYRVTVDTFVNVL